jgi:hypothetical protein
VCVCERERERERVSDIYRFWKKSILKHLKKKKNLVNNIFVKRRILGL